MNIGLRALLAVTPILLAALLLVGLRWPARRAMPAVYSEPPPLPPDLLEQTDIGALDDG